jgi:hypothetical protein
MRVVVPVRAIEVNAVPLDLGPAEKLIERESGAFGDDIAALAERRERLGEPVDVGVPFNQPPVEPVDVAVLVIRVVVAALGPAYLVAHQEHRRSRRKELQNEKVLDLAIA